MSYPVPVFSGKVEHGKVLLQRPKAYQAEIERLEGKQIELVIRKLRVRRSNQESRYYFGVVVPLIAEACGYTEQEAHRALGLKFFVIYKDNALPTVQSTADMTTVEFEDRMRQIRQWADQFLEVYIPVPNEAEP
jgi:hypothetical protein